MCCGSLWHTRRARHRRHASAPSAQHSNNIRSPLPTDCVERANTIIYYIYTQKLLLACMEWCVCVCALTWVTSKTSITPPRMHSPRAPPPRPHVFLFLYIHLYMCTHYNTHGANRTMPNNQNRINVQQRRRRRRTSRMHARKVHPKTDSRTNICIYRVSRTHITHK